VSDVGLWRLWYGPSGPITCNLVGKVINTSGNVV
jgi:hypothetical protein